MCDGDVGMFSEGERVNEPEASAPRPPVQDRICLEGETRRFGYFGGRGAGLCHKRREKRKLT